MPFHQLPPMRRVTWTAAVASVVLMALAWDGGSGSAAASPRRRSGRQGGECPLTVPQQIKSINAFQKMIPVFRSPRCSNCHGGIADPLGSNTPTNHMGIAEIRASDGAQVCEECHMDQWHVAPLTPWTGQSDLQLCGFMKEGNTAAEFIDHVIRDRGGPQFIEAAFKGMRGLNDGGLTIAEEDLGRITPRPPPVTHAEFIQLTRDWVNAQGGSFAGDNDCGCTLDKIDVEYTSTITIAQKPPLKGSSKITGTGSKRLYLGPDLSEPEFFATTGPAELAGTIDWSRVEVNRGNGCVVTLQASPASEVVLWLGVAASPEVKVEFQFVPSLDLHSVQESCPHPVTGRMYKGMAGQKEGGLFQAGWIALHGMKVQMTAASMPNLAAMDPARLQAMADRMQNAPTQANGAELRQMMRQFLPNSDAMLEQARSNFAFTMPGEWCKPDEVYLAICTIKRTVSSQTGGAAVTITEDTEFKFAR